MAGRRRAAARAEERRMELEQEADWLTGCAMKAAGS